MSNIQINFGYLTEYKHPTCIHELPSTMNTILRHEVSTTEIATEKTIGRFQMSRTEKYNLYFAIKC